MRRISSFARRGWSLIWGETTVELGLDLNLDNGWGKVSEQGIIGDEKVSKKEEDKAQGETIDSVRWEGERAEKELNKDWDDKIEMNEEIDKCWDEWGTWQILIGDHGWASLLAAQTKLTAGLMQSLQFRQILNNVLRFETGILFRPNRSYWRFYKHTIAPVKRKNLYYRQ